MALHQHLASCDDCRRIFDEYQRLRSGFRELPPTPAPPPELARSVWSETVDRPPASRARRFLGETSAKVGLSTAAALALLIIISAFLLVRGYNQGIAPSVTSPVAVTDQSWPIYQPIKIQFNKAMNHESVEDNLQIYPPGERSRIPMSWDNNTLILGSSASQNKLFLPETTYRVMVLGTARDSFGHSLGKTFSVSFRTSSITDTAKNVTPAPTPPTRPSPTPGTNQDSGIAQKSTATASFVGPATTSQTPVGTATAPASSTVSTTTDTTPTPSVQAGTATTTSNVASTPESISTAASPTATQSATPIATATATPVETPSPTAQATPSPTTATPTSDALAPAGTPTESGTPALGTPTPTVIPVTGAFGSVYWAFNDVQTKLGTATAPEAAMSAAELGFQRGTMYERYDLNEIYVLYSNNQWGHFQDTWTAADGPGGGPAPEDQLWIPNDGFGLVWNSDPSLAKSIGYAINQDSHVMGGVFQQFTHGIMLYSDQGFVYVLYDDETWQLYPDTSGHGDLITPTPPATGETTTSAATTTPVSDVPDVTPATAP